jgi:hypothetical protein
MMDVTRFAAPACFDNHNARCHPENGKFMTRTPEEIANQCLLGRPGQYVPLPAAAMVHAVEARMSTMSSSRCPRTTRIDKWVVRVALHAPAL